MRTQTMIGRAFAVGKIPARDWTFEVRDAADTAWLAIGGLNSFTPASTKNDTDGTVFGSAGWLEHWTMSRSAQLTLEGFMYEDDADGDRDAGQERCETLARAVGSGSLGEFQVTSPGGTIFAFNASVDVPVIPTEGGGNDDFAGWRCILKQSGQVTIT